MANEEHFNILKQGLGAWNQWRKHNPETRPDLSDAILCSVDFSGEDLIRADLSETNLSGANLRDANLSGVSLMAAMLVSADLRNADLSLADLRFANLSFAKLNDANLSRATLYSANLSDANLSGANLRDAGLSSAEFTGADLRNADLREADLGGADLTAANLSNANLQGAFLAAARLINANLDEANLTDAVLWETQRAGWSIRSIICESVYWSTGDLSDLFSDLTTGPIEEKTTYQVGEFERLFAEKTIIRLFYKEGISPLEIATIPALIKHLDAAHPGYGLRLVSIREESGGAVVELAIEDFDEHASDQLKKLQSLLEAEAQQKVEYQRQLLLEGNARWLLQARFEQLSVDFDKMLQLPHTMVNIQGGHMGDKYEISGQAGAIGPNAQAHDITFNQIWNQLQGSVELPKLADELSRLRQEMKKEAVEPEHDIAVSEIAKAEQCAKAGEGSKTVEHLKSAGKWALDIATKIGTSLAVEAIKKSL